jgi:hypothetical protein
MALTLDLNSPAFQSQLFRLEKDDQVAILRACAKIAAMEWEAVYRDPGLRWEAIVSRRGAAGVRLYSLRITKNVRGIVRRTGEAMAFLALHADHDSAYN